MKSTVMLLLSLAAGLPFGPSQEGQGKPPQRPNRPDGGQKPGRIESLVKLPEDFVQFVRLPEGGVHPRLGVGPGPAALLFFKGEEAGGDLFLTRTGDEGASFQPARRVNAEPGTVVVWAGLHAGSVDVGPDGRAHVAWIAGKETPTLFYASETAEGGLALQELGAPPGLSSTTALALDGAGQVYLFYVATGPGPAAGGAPRPRIWMRRSGDGSAFGEPVPVDFAIHGISSASAIAAHVDELKGTLFVLYRSAFQQRPEEETVTRDLRLLSSEDQGSTFRSVVVDRSVDRSKQQHDPHSSACLAQETSTTLAAWDAQGRVQWAAIRRNLNRVDLPVEARDETRTLGRTHAATAAGGTEVLLAWVERPEADATAPARIAWQAWYREGRARLGVGEGPELGTLSSPAILPRAGKPGFVIFY